MPRRPHLILAVLLLAGCAGPVELAVPSPDAAAAAACSGVISVLPATVLDQDRRDTTGGPLTAAWGDPPITLRCGVPAPAGLDPASPCLDVNGIGWYEAAQAGGSLFTTIGRDAYVEVAVPADYAPESGALVDVAAAITAHDPLRQPCSG